MRQGNDYLFPPRTARNWNRDHQPHENFGSRGRSGPCSRDEVHKTSEFFTLFKALRMMRIMNDLRIIAPQENNFAVGFFNTSLPYGDTINHKRLIDT